MRLTRPDGSTSSQSRLITGYRRQDTHQDWLLSPCRPDDDDSSQNQAEKGEAGGNPGKDCPKPGEICLVSIEKRGSREGNEQKRQYRQPDPYISYRLCRSDQPFPVLADSRHNKTVPLPYGITPRFGTRPPALQVPVCPTYPAVRATHRRSRGTLGRAKGDRWSSYEKRHGEAVGASYVRSPGTWWCGGGMLCEQ